MEQRLVQSPQMIQAMQILQLSAMDLQERIDAELAENPFLEVAGDTPDAPADGGGEGAAPKDGTKTAEEAAPERDGLEQMLEAMERFERDFGDGARSVPSGGEEGDRKYEAMQNTPNQPETLAQALMAQAAILDLDERQGAILEYLVFSLDQRGYLPEPIHDIAALLSHELEPEVKPEEVYGVLMRLREVSHPAIGARDLAECLLLQLDARGMDQPLARTILEEHLADLEANRLPRVAKATGSSLEDIKQALEIIQNLDPIPGSEYGGSLNSAIHPDVIVEEEDGQYRVRLDRERLRDLTISPQYRKMLEQSKSDPKVREWVKKRLESARWFIDAVAQRQSTLERIAEALFARQEEFLERGVSSLKPLRMQEVADTLGVHISTISRGVAGKHAQTPRGIYPLKFFFSSGTTNDSGEAESQVSIQEKVRKIVEAEDRKKPLSDDQIARVLGETEGIHIARRTVTKYRKALGLPSSTKRRAY